MHLKCGGLGVFLDTNFAERIAQKLLMVILLLFGLIICQLLFGKAKARQPIIFMIWDLGTNHFSTILS